MTQSIHDQRLLILDFGSQYTQLIARRVRELGVYCELHPYDMDEQAITAFAPQGIILSGGPESVTADNGPKIPEVVFTLSCPVLGICYGMQAMVAQLGGEVETGEKREFGHTNVRLVNQSALFSTILTTVEQELDVWMSHGDKVNRLPKGFQTVVSSDSCPVAAISNEDKQWYGLQFHPEVTHTQQGLKLLENFVHKICQCQSLWQPENIINESIEAIRKQVGDDHVVLGLSGGVDSSVVAVLLHLAIGEQLTCIFVDTGLLRLNEAEQVMATLGQHMGVKIIKVDAQQQFYQALKGLDDPEQKRKVVGKEFIHVFEQQASRIKDAKWLAQGTIYPDVIESAGSKTSKAKVIKSHHNVGGLPEDMALELLEPLRELFKDEVRKIGLELGLPKELVYRHPFPGPGLAVRILGEVKQAYADTLRQADAIFMEELHAQDYYYKVNQAFAVFLPVKSVGVVGDGRCYEPVIALRAVTTTDFMTAACAELPFSLLTKVATRIVNEVAGVSRVTYDMTSKPPATIEWE